MSTGLTSLRSASSARPAEMLTHNPRFSPRMPASIPRQLFPRSRSSDREPELAYNNDTDTTVKERRRRPPRRHRLRSRGAMPPARLLQASSDSARDVARLLFAALVNRGRARRGWLCKTPVFTPLREPCNRRQGRLRLGRSARSHSSAGRRPSGRVLRHAAHVEIEPDLLADERSDSPKGTRARALAARLLVHRSSSGVGTHAERQGDRCRTAGATRSHSPL